MLMVDFLKLPEKVTLPVNLATVSFIMPFVPKGQKEPEKSTCILSMTNGATLHVEATMKSVVGMINNARK